MVGGGPSWAEPPPPYAPCSAHSSLSSLSPAQKGSRHRAFNSVLKAALGLQVLKGSLQGWRAVGGGPPHLRVFLDIKQLLQNFEMS